MKLHFEKKNVPKNFRYFAGYQWFVIRFICANKNLFSCCCFVTDLLSGPPTFRGFKSIPVTARTLSLLKINRCGYVHRFLVQKIHPHVKKPSLAFDRATPSGFKIQSEAQAPDPKTCS